MQTFFASLFALVAFAANSVLCRLALGAEAIDAASFTIVRLLSGAITLLIIVALVSKKTAQNSTDAMLPNHSEDKSRVWNVFNMKRWLAPSMLFTYAVTFSFAYTQLNTATGALILFGVVQLSMITQSILTGNRLSKQEWVGVATAAAGFAFLMLPSAETPSLTGSLLMSIAGLSWAIYTLVGKQSKSPLFDTCHNFLLTIPFVILLGLSSFSLFSISKEGILLAIASGAIASGVGYAVWYLALPNLSITQAAVSQLSVPVIATLGGVLLVAEPLTTHLSVSMLLVLGGIALVILARKQTAPPKPSEQPQK